MKRVWDTIVGVIIAAFLLFIVYNMVTGGRSIITDVTNLVHAVTTSPQPVEHLPIPPASDSGFPPCIAEGAPNYPCYWDADTMGNGQGVSFVRDVTGTFVYGWDE